MSRLWLVDLLADAFFVLLRLVLAVAVAALTYGMICLLPDGEAGTVVAAFEGALAGMFCLLMIWVGGLLFLGLRPSYEFYWSVHGWIDLRARRVRWLHEPPPLSRHLVR
ncbi:hypothetical protein CXB49_09560 [Chromobacterium sp. ATCC 53434]|uniref:hypothetical protein n=1 Tax=Chromobacterium sp. (strain ATCC 53434 / SC 14030) TaxID=2059672 RepID=UPI000C7937DF|nr:hypothetical protein [Chromobacterium sp. ATCC 53434]AUH51040.1 hypothetical protein CXB49_09560 [Chromobacterium sp. ATCC 53434]